MSESKKLKPIVRITIQTFIGFLFIWSTYSWVTMVQNPFLELSLGFALVILAANFLGSSIIWAIEKFAVKLVKGVPVSK